MVDRRQLFQSAQFSADMNPPSLHRLGVAILLLTAEIALPAEFEPPWNPPLEEGENFTVPGIDNVPDLQGDVNDPDLVVFLAGNQYMVVRDLVRAFKDAYPAYRRVFVETLPPGVLVRQIERGALIVGNLRVTLEPDVYAGGWRRMQELQRDKQWFARTVDYARNRLAIMTPAGNPERVAGWSDLARAALPICMPNPQWEAIAVHQIIPALHDAGGEQLVQDIYEHKVQDGSNFVTQIHHRQIPLRIMQGKCAAGAVWYTEAYFHAVLTRHPISMVTLPDSENRYSVYTAGLMNNAPHRQAGEDFLRFLQSPQGQAIYGRYGFLPPQ
jgi:molybdate transport system substrate-binding protein